MVAVCCFCASGLLHVSSLDSQYDTVMLQTWLLHQHIVAWVERLQLSHCSAYMGLIAVDDELHERSSADSESLLHLSYSDLDQNIQ